MWPVSSKKAPENFSNLQISYVQLVTVKNEGKETEKDIHT